MPRGFWFPSPEPRVWVPMTLVPERQNGSYTLVGLAAPGRDVRHMEPQVARLMQMLGERFQYPEEWDKSKGGSVTPIRDELLGPMRPGLYATLAAMGLILLIGCANVAALMLGQVEGRTTELAVRSALGANRRRLTQQLLVEALIVGVLAALLGAGLAAFGFRMLAAALPLGAWAESAVFDWRMFAVALGVALTAALLVALVPVAALWRGDLRGPLSGTRTGGIQGRGGRLERALVVTQVALAMLIASGAALLVRSVANLYDIDPGLETAGVAVIDVVPSGDLTSAQRMQAMDALREALRNLPGVRSASAAMKIPLRGNGNNTGFSIPGRPELQGASTFFRPVALDYFETMGIRLEQGRVFAATDLLTEADSNPTEIPVIINEDLARRYFPGESPIGRIVRGGYGQIDQRIIGIVANAAEGALTDTVKPARYFLAGAVAWWPSPVTLVVKTERASDAPALLDVARATVHRIAPSYAVVQTTTMERVLDVAVGPARQVMMLLTLLSGLALVLGAIGIYGVIAHFAARRKRDWAIRMALGLPGGRVVRHIVGQGTALVAAGVVIGALGTLALARLLASFLFGVSSVDPLAFAAAGAVLLAIGMAAAFVPARRAATVDPAIALREQ
jgi:predicted permease